MKICVGMKSGHSRMRAAPAMLSETGRAALQTYSILAETALSFLGFGLRSSALSWGPLRQRAQNFHSVATYPWPLVPAAFVIIIVMAFKSSATACATPPTPTSSNPRATSPPPHLQSRPRWLYVWPWYGRRTNPEVRDGAATKSHSQRP